MDQQLLFGTVICVQYLCEVVTDPRLLPLNSLRAITFSTRIDHPKTMLIHD